MFSGETRLKSWTLDPQGQQTLGPSPPLTFTAVKEVSLLCSPTVVPGAAWKLYITAVVLTLAVLEMSHADYTLHVIFFMNATLLRTRCNRPNPCCNSFSDEKIEDLGRGAVVRLIGNLGMGRYAHRFRAFAVTGSDLSSCTEQDLIQIGVSFRCVAERVQIRNIRCYAFGCTESTDEI